MKILFTDKSDIKNWEEFPDGRLIVPVTLTRTGVFKYRYSDIFGNTENKDYPRSLFKDGIINIYRSFEEVNKSINSMKGMYFTDEHPKENVTSDNQKVLSKGQISTVINVREEKYNDYSIYYYDSEVTITDKVVKDYIKNKVKEQVSLGYNAGFLFQKGEFAGVAYDAIQVDIENNHTALTKRGRAGEKVKIQFGDSFFISPIEDSIDNDKKEIFIMDLKGVKINFSDSNSEVLVENELKDKDQKINDLTSKANLVDSLEAQVLKLEKDLQDAKSVDLELIADERLNIISKAKHYVKDSDFKGKSNLEIMKMAVSSYYSGKDLKDKSEGFFKDSFDLLDDKSKSTNQKPSIRDSVQGIEIKADVFDFDSQAERLSKLYEKGVK